MIIAHLTSAHPRYDTRIFFKMCKSLSKSNFSIVYQVVADGRGNESKDGVEIIDVGKNSSGRLLRMSIVAKEVYRKARELNADIYHLHDPELIPCGILLKWSGKKVIFDSHEDLPRDMKDKKYLNLLLRYSISYLFMFIEYTIFRMFDSVVAATPHIRDKFLRYGIQSVDINNFPILEEFENKYPNRDKKHAICYVGGITQVRGVKEIVQSLGLLKSVRLNLVGTFESEKFRSEIALLDEGWKYVDEWGHQDRKGVTMAMHESKIGMVTLLPANNFIDSLPVKMFEYMAAKLPVIASNFPLWKTIIEENNCGLCVNPTNIEEIAEVINKLMSDDELRLKMAKNGYELVRTNYNWANEEKKLIDLYHSIITKG